MPRMERDRMVSTQIEARGITDSLVLQAMRDVPRERFVPASLVHLAYDDGPLATVFADPTSPIRARVLDEPDAVIDSTWVRGRAEAAAQRRSAASSASSGWRSIVKTRLATLASTAAA